MFTFFFIWNTKKNINIMTFETYNMNENKMLFAKTYFWSKHVNNLNLITKGLFLRFDYLLFIWKLQLDAESALLMNWVWVAFSVSYWIGIYLNRSRKYHWLFYCFSLWASDFSQSLYEFKPKLNRLINLGLAN